MRRRPPLSGLDPLPVEPGLLRTFPRRERRGHGVAPVLELDLVDVDDVRGTLGGRAVLERRALGLDLPGIVRAPLDPRPADAHGARPREPAELGAEACREDEILEAVGPGHEGVLHLVCALDHAVIGANLVHRVVLPGEARPTEHVVQLLGGSVRVGRSRKLPRRDVDAVHTDTDRTRGAAETLPGRVHLADRASVPLDLVPVRQHGAKITQARR